MILETDETISVCMLMAQRVIPRPKVVETEPGYLTLRVPPDNYYPRKILPMAGEFKEKKSGQ